MDLEIHRLTPERLSDFLDFFDNRAFEDNPAWSGCYCVFYHHDGEEADWARRSKEDNRSFAENLVRTGALTGFLAYNDGVPVGWCNVNDKRRFFLAKNRAEAPSPDDDDVAAIVCFVIYHLNRRRGISAALLEHVIAHYRDSGIRRLEAYPLNEGVEGIHYHGPLSLYLRHGFSVHRKLKDYSVVKRDMR